MSDYSVLQAVDFGLGQLLAKIYSEGADSGPKNWRQLLKRPPQHKIFRGDFDEPYAAVRSIESAAIAKQASQWVSANRPSLPIVLYGRKPNVRTVEAEAGGHRSDVYATTNSGQQVKLSFAMMEVEYRLMLMAWDKPTLDAMQLAWIFHVSNAAKRGHKFDLAYEIDGEPLEGIIAEVIDPKTAEFEDTSLPVEQGRLHAVSLPIRVKAYAIQGAKVAVPDRIGWQVDINVGGETIRTEGTTPPAGFERDPNTGYYVDPDTGRYFDPVNGIYYNPGDSFEYDPDTGHFIDADAGIGFDPENDRYYDLETGDTIPPEQADPDGHGRYEDRVKPPYAALPNRPGLIQQAGYVPCQECRL